MPARIMSLFLSEKVGLYSITRSKVSPMIAINMLRKVICRKKVVQKKRKKQSAVLTWLS